MARRSALSKLLKAESGAPRFSFGNTEKRLAALLQQIENNAPESIITHKTDHAHSDVSKVLRGFIGTDIAAFVLGLICAWSLAAIINSLFFDRFALNGVSKQTFIQVLQPFLISACVVLWFEHTGHYHVRMPFWMETKTIVGVTSFAMLIDGFFKFASRQDFSRLWLMSNWVFAAIAIIAFRSIYRSYLRRRGQWQIRTLLVGSGPTAEQAIMALESERGLGYEIVGQISDLSLALQKAANSWQTLCAMSHADHVLIALSGHEIMDAEQPLAQLVRESVPFSVSPPLHNLPVLGMMPQYFFNHNVMLLTRSHGLDQPLPRFFKRAFDIVVAATVLLLASPIFLILAMLVKLDGGPALFGHKRLGLNGKAFSCLKFRSMVLNSDEVLQKHLAENPEAQEEWQRDHKLRNDPRVTMTGALLRRTSLDELPQLINVLRGDMSIVGPRPIIMAEVKKYDDDIAHYYRVRPGITGLWQVSGRNDVSYAKRVHMDSWYVRNWSLWHDIAIICKTIPVVIGRDGAY
ncbi:MAG: undecaprenyl-phosphate galactose phosphotransferase WbaP [Pseudomonadota bacterium]|nr:undecaprenyl-phosphate galactose phosphotransferase WbaP [Pseudomonadota bacterium]